MHEKYVGVGSSGCGLGGFERPFESSWHRVLRILVFPCIDFSCLALACLAWLLLAVASLFPKLRGFAELVLAVSASCGSLICLTLAWLDLWWLMIFLREKRRLWAQTVFLSNH